VFPKDTVVEETEKGYGETLEISGRRAVRGPDPERYWGGQRIGWREDLLGGPKGMRISRRGRPS